MSQSAATPTTTVTITGTCLCKSTRYRCTGIPKGGVICYCSNCRQSSGSAFAHNYRLFSAEITFTQGGDLVREYADSATKNEVTLYRHFCGNCGCPLYLTHGKWTGMVVLQVGNIEGHTQAEEKPNAEFFEEERKKWLGLVEINKSNS